MPVTITPERPDGTDAAELIAELDALLEPLYPSESRHGYSVAKLIDQGVAFFVLRADGEPAGCGGVQLFGAEYGELKRMYVRPRFRGLGLGRLLLEHLEAYARGRGVGLVRLETGVHQGAAIQCRQGKGREAEPVANKPSLSKVAFARSNHPLRNGLCPRRKSVPARSAPQEPSLAA